MEEEEGYPPEVRAERGRERREREESRRRGGTGIGRC